MRQAAHIRDLAVVFSLLILTTSNLSAAVPDKLSGTIKADGSSTVFPITEAISEEFQSSNRDVKVTVGISGTGGGFKKFCAGESDLQNASRPIKQIEFDTCAKNGVEYLELPVAYDALTIAVHPSNSWANSITVAELKKLWEPEAQGKIMKWNQIRAEWPDKPIKLYGAGVDSGTYDYFTEAIVGKEHSSRGDYTSSEDDNVLVQGVSRDVNSLGFFGLAYYEENKDKLKALALDDSNPANGAGAINASIENVILGSYQPLARPLFIYISKRSLERPEVREFGTFYLNNAEKLVAEVGYVPLQNKVYSLALARFQNRVVGSIFRGHGSQVGISLESLLSKPTS